MYVVVIQLLFICRYMCELFIIFVSEYFIGESNSSNLFTCLRWRKRMNSNQTVGHWKIGRPLRVIFVFNCFSACKMYTQNWQDNLFGSKQIYEKLDVQKSHWKIFSLLFFFVHLISLCKFSICVLVFACTRKSIEHNNSHEQWTCENHKQRRNRCKKD